MAFYASGFTGLTAAAFTGITGVMQNFQLVLFLVQVANTPHSWREVSKVLNKQEKRLDVTGSAHKTHVFFLFCCFGSTALTVNLTQLIVAILKFLQYRTKRF